MAKVLNTGVFINNSFSLIILDSGKFNIKILKMSMTNEDPIPDS